MTLTGYLFLRGMRCHSVGYIQKIGEEAIASLKARYIPQTNIDLVLSDLDTAATLVDPQSLWISGTVEVHVYTNDSDMVDKRYEITV